LSFHLDITEFLGQTYIFCINIIVRWGEFIIHSYFITYLYNWTLRT